MKRPLDVPPLPTFGGQKERRRLSGPGLRTCFNILKEWQIAPAEQAALLGVDVATLEIWRGDTERCLSRTQLERVSLVVGVYGGLHSLLPRELANDWIKLPNAHPIYGGRIALAAIIENPLQVLYQTRRQLEAEVSASRDAAHVTDFPEKFVMWIDDYPDECRIDKLSS